MAEIDTAPLPQPRPVDRASEWAVDFRERIDAAVAWVAEREILDAPLFWLLAGVAVLTLLISWIRRLSRLSRDAPEFELDLLGELERSRKLPPEEFDLGLPVGTGQPPPPRPKCRWKRDRRRRSDATLERWVCRTCGVDAFSSDGRAPKECKRHLRESRL